MKMIQYYSHLNGLEFLIVHKPKLWREIINVIEKVDASDTLTKISSEKTKKGKLLYSPTELNALFKDEFTKLNWREMRTHYYVNEDLQTTKNSVDIRDEKFQKQFIENHGFVAYRTYNQVDFVKERVAVEVQFGKYFAVQYDLHVKHTFFFERGDIDVGVEIIPMHSLMKEMSSGVAWYENELTNIVREGRSNPSVPIILIGVAPNDNYLK
ncbi:MAG: hypothetical protein IJ563_08510 [Selenomonadaceae bacterium]|nr:hypothetical protein [Selenomonadaceae bacterium]